MNLSDESLSSLRIMANAARMLSVDAIEKAKSGHPGMAMGIADVVTILFAKWLRFNPADPLWPDRDRLILSAGHGVMIQYVAMYLSGYKRPDINDIMHFRQLHSCTPGHPEYGETPGIEATTGPLGQGIANAVGMAIAGKKLQAQFGKERINHKIYVIAGDGCMMEGISHEAASLAGHLQLDNLIVFFDSNRITIDGSTDMTVSENTADRFIAYGWNTMIIDGHDFSEINDAIEKSQSSTVPVLIECRTTIARGSCLKEGSNKSHGSPLGADEVSKTRINLAWEHEPFVVSDGVMDMWRRAGRRSEEQYEVWMAGDGSTMLPHIEVNPLFDVLRSQMIADRKTEATRVASGRVVELVVQHIPECIGGSADLTESNHSKGSAMPSISHDSFSGKYLHYGVREHAMGAIMNGLSLSGFRPYAGTFLIFSDYMRPAVRLAAIMKQPVIYVMTHDSIGVGEDGPTHQPIEHLASLRAMPNVLVFRPADSVETLDAWRIALAQGESPAILALSRQNLPYIDCEHSTHLGAYVVRDLGAEVTILATGSEVAIALQAQEILKDMGIKSRVISMPCWQIFEKQSAEYRDSILNNGGLMVAVEAGARLGWDRYIGRDGIFIGMESFGLSAPSVSLFEYFGITAADIARKINSHIQLIK